MDDIKHARLQSLVRLRGRLALVRDILRAHRDLELQTEFVAHDDHQPPYTLIWTGDERLFVESKEGMLDQLRKRRKDTARFFMRALRYETLIRTMMDQVSASSTGEFDYYISELADSLWWQIRAIRIMQRQGRPKGSITKKQVKLRQLLKENPSATENDLWHRCRKELPGAFENRASFASAVDRARKAIRIKSS